MLLLLPRTLFLGRIPFVGSSSICTHGEFPHLQIDLFFALFYSMVDGWDSWWGGKKIFGNWDWSDKILFNFWQMFESCSEWQRFLLPPAFSSSSSIFFNPTNPQHTEPDLFWHFVRTCSHAVPEQFPKHLVMRHVATAMLAMLLDCRTAHKMFCTMHSMSRYVRPSLMCILCSRLVCSACCCIKFPTCCLCRSGISGKKFLW